MRFQAYFQNGLTKTNIFLLHFFVSVGIYYLTKHRAKRWSIVLIVFTVSTYASVIITLFVFPFTDWDKDYANYLIICSLCFWMFSIIICVAKHYKHIVYNKKNLILWNIVSASVYLLGSIAYFIMHTFFPSELSGILAAEICSGLSVVIFLACCFVHLWKIQLIVKVPG